MEENGEKDDILSQQKYNFKLKNKILAEVLTMQQDFPCLREAQNSDKELKKIILLNNTAY
jgi:hypothetical protein